MKVQDAEVVDLMKRHLVEKEEGFKEMIQVVMMMIGKLWKCQPPLNLVRDDSLFLIDPVLPEISNHNNNHLDRDFLDIRGHFCCPQK